MARVLTNVLFKKYSDVSNACLQNEKGRQSSNDENLFSWTWPLKIVQGEKGIRMSTVLRALAFRNSLPKYRSDSDNLWRPLRPVPPLLWWLPFVTGEQRLWTLAPFHTTSCTLSSFLGKMKFLSAGLFPRTTSFRSETDRSWVGRQVCGPCTVAGEEKGVESGLQVKDRSRGKGKLLGIKFQALGVCCYSNNPRHRPVETSYLVRAPSMHVNLLTSLASSGAWKLVCARRNWISDLYI